ncbi:MAG: tetratricopeptide repeat protein [Deltaproteobacteria bacterium]|nr:tetratricopeptide repeat protein [Deltaproteobacteria bacterium]MBW2304412.1 tetratricopeptide repeat protein [Deltaproteobacteria bacterium]
MNEIGIGDQVRMGENLFAEGMLEEAERVFLSILKEDPKNKDGLNNLGVIAHHRQDFDKARKYFLQALRVDPFYQDAIDNLILVQQSCREGTAPLIEERGICPENKHEGPGGSVPCGFRENENPWELSSDGAPFRETGVPWKFYTSPGVIHHAEKVRKMLGLEHYVPSLHSREPVWFFGLYFDQDFLQVLAHQGRKILNWRGSDALKLKGNQARIEILEKVEALHVCQSERQQAILRELGLKAVVRPMLNGDPRAYWVTPFPDGETMLLVFWRRGIDDFIQADLFFEIAARCPDVIFHIVGDEDPDRFNRPGMENLLFHGFVSEETLEDLMDRCKGTLRPWISDGTPNIQTIMLLKGRYAAHSCRFEKVTQCRTADDYVEWIQWLKNVKEPNLEAREWWLDKLNNFDFLQPDFDPEKAHETP